MNARLLPSLFRRHRGLRWAAPVVVTGVIVLIASGVFSTAEPTSGHLPRTTPAALLAQLGAHHGTGFSGTVVSHVSLGLPDLPALDGTAAGSPLATLLSGTRTLQVWYGGVDEQRVALLSSTDETDLFHSGRTVWRWDSTDREADRVRLGPAQRAGAGTTTAMTPGGLADLALNALRPTTHIAVRSGGLVADRSTYDLVLTPRTSSTLVGSVHIAIDGETKVPLGVQVYPRGSSTPAVDVSYTSVHFGQPSASNFRFTPPVGATVHHVSLRALRGDDLSPGRVSLGGSGWSSVLSYDLGRSVHLRGLGLDGALTSVSGAWGKGQLLQTALVSVLITPSGHVYTGAVYPTALYAAAAGDEPSPAKRVSARPRAHHSSSHKSGHK